MTGLPVSIEAYLLDSGFSSTEILVLKKLLEGEACTLRELAAKTGKSTGVLDQATKKLLSKKLISRDTINDTPKYLLKSLDAVMQWMQEDRDEKLRHITSRARDFESFVASLKMENTRPDIEYFEGFDGITKAYLKLLQVPGIKEMLHFRPVNCKEEEDPLRDFFVQYFRERRKRGVFSRVLVPDIPLGRRFQSRDAFEYRKSVLVPESVFPMPFEKIVAGNVVACFNHAEKRACFLKYTELARSERGVFEALWSRPKDSSAPQVSVVPNTFSTPVISLHTRTLSTIREFLLSRKSIALFAACAVLAGGITYGLYQHNLWLNTERVRERAMAIAATAATEFDLADIEQLHTAEDVAKPVFGKLVKHLQTIRSQNENVLYAYIYRPTGKLNPSWEVVADADYGVPAAMKDINKNGVLEVSEQMIIPGQLYEYDDFNVEEELRKTMSSLVSDEWGNYYDATSPIFDSSGKGVAIVGVDIDVQQVHNLTRESFAWVFYFLGFFLLFVLFRLAAFNRQLFKALLLLLRSTKSLIAIGVCSFLALGITYGIYRYTLELMFEQVGTRLVSIAATAAPEIDAKDLEVLHTIEDMKRPEYQRVFKKLNEIRSQNEGVKYAYVMRLTEKRNISEFVADADTNFDTPLLGADSNFDGIADLLNTASFPGLKYDTTGQTMGVGDWEAFYEKDFVEDQWGKVMYANAPIKNENNLIVAWVGIDMDVTDFTRLIQAKFSPYLWFFSLFFVLWLGWILGVGVWEWRKSSFA